MLIVVIVDGIKDEPKYFLKIAHRVMTIQKDVLFISVEQEIKHHARISRYSLDYIHKQ